MAKDEFFGSDDQRAVLRRGRGMAALLENDARFSYYGRTVGLASPDDGSINCLAALAKVQGNSNYSAVPNSQTASVVAELEKRDLVPMVYTKWQGRTSAIAAARKVVNIFPLPEDIELVWLDGSTPGELLESLASMALGSGVLPLCGEVLRGLHKPAVCLAAVDQSANVISCAAAAIFTHENHAKFRKQAWWGMLATDPKRRGQRLALILGAHALLEMKEKFGVRDFMTGVEPENAPSEAVCTRMGLSPSNFNIVGCADPQALASGRMTK